METIPHNPKGRASSSSFKTKLAASFSRAIKARVKPEACPGELLTTKHNLDVNRWSFTPPQRGGHSTGSSSLADPVDYTQRGSYRHYYYHGYSVDNGDKNVDSKAESYISNVRERFELERSDMEQ